ncbi:MAG: hypothetical protein ACK5P5_03190 [Pseudobdellovibrionaceae bacterium]
MLAKNFLGIFFVFMLFHSNSYASIPNSVDPNRVDPSTCSVSDSTITAVEEWLKSDLNHSSDVILRLQIISALKKDTCVSSKLSELSIRNKSLLNDSGMGMLADRISENFFFKTGLTVREVIENFFYE